MKTSINKVLICIAVLIITLACKDSKSISDIDNAVQAKTSISNNNCDHTATRIKNLKDDLQSKTISTSGNSDGILADQYIYFPADVNQLVKDLKNENGQVKMKKCPCNNMPMVLSNVYIEYEPKIRRGKIRSEDEGGRFPISNRLILTEVSGEIENVDPTKFSSSKLKPHKKGDIKVAIIDTGVDAKLFTSDYLWQPSTDAYQSQNRSARKFKVNGGINLFPNGVSLNDVDVSLKEIYKFPQDDEGHGTAVAAVVNRVAQEGFEYMIIKGLDINGNSTLFDMICSIEYAYENGADYINTSWGFYGIQSARTAIDEMHDFFADQQQRPKIFASLGNMAINSTDLKHYPSEYSNDFANISDVSAATGGTNSIRTMRNKRTANFANFSNFSCTDLSIIYPADGIRILNQSIRGTSFAAPQALAYQFLADHQNERIDEIQINDTYKIATIK